MQPHWKGVYGAIAVIYYCLAWYWLAVFDAGIVATALVLFGIPALVLARFTYAPPIVLINVAVFGLGVGLILESTAHIFGLWYTLGINEARLFGLVPIEALIVIALEVSFLALLYELIFDDGIYTTTSARARFSAVLVFAVGAVVLLFIQSILWAQYFVTNAYAWILFIILASSLAALSVYRVYTPQFLDRIVYFSIIGAIPSFIALALSVTNLHKVYANPEQYIFTFRVFGELVPLEAFLMVLALPFFIATMYELYLDDKS